MRTFRCTVFLLWLSLGCSTDDAPHPDASIVPDPTTCEGWEAITVPATDIGEVRLAGRIVTPSISYACGEPNAPNETTWSYWPRYRDGRVGSYGKTTIGSTRCDWRDAIEQRTPARGTCEN